MREEILRWWKQAEMDFRGARHAFQYKDHYLVVFLCQQAIEKGIKALVLNKRNEKRLLGSHSLIFLAKEVKMPEKFYSFLRELTPQYVLTRYPDASDSVPGELYDKDIAKRFLDKSEEVMEWIKKHLK